MTKTLCFTGHRPDKLLGYDMRDNVQLLTRLKEKITYYIEKEDVTRFISGMALGVDMWSAFIVLKLKETYPHIKLISAIPCKDQFSIWKNKDAIDDWHYVIERADEVHYVSEEPYTAWCLQKRNEWMVNNSDFVLAIWDGTKGGTHNCIKYAKKKLKAISYIDDEELFIKNKRGRQF